MFSCDYRSECSAFWRCVKAAVAYLITQGIKVNLRCCLNLASLRHPQIRTPSNKDTLNSQHIDDNGTPLKDTLKYGHLRSLDWVPTSYKYMYILNSPENKDSSLVCCVCIVYDIVGQAYNVMVKVGAVTKLSKGTVVSQENVVLWDSIVSYPDCPFRRVWEWV